MSVLPGVCTLGLTYWLKFLEIQLGTITDIKFNIKKKPALCGFASFRGIIRNYYDIKFNIKKKPALCGFASFRGIIKNYYKYKI